MRLRKKHGVSACMAIFLSLLCCFTVKAADMAVVENYTGESEVVIYLKGMDGDCSSAEVQAGTSACTLAEAGRLAESGQPVETLVMLDNSKSISKKDRKRITEILKNLISDRMENEEIAIATFNEGLIYLADYTSDYDTLLEAVDAITYRKSSTYLTDVLYDLLDGEYVGSRDDSFRRIIVISDGMDNKPIGYTKDELFSLLKEYPVPIYTIGAKNSGRDNNDQLENMFSISRQTGADSFLLGDTQVQDISQALNEIGDIVRLCVVLPQELMDGSKKMLKVTFPSGETVSVEVFMPQQMQSAGPLDSASRTDAEDGETDEHSVGAEAHSGESDTGKSSGSTVWLLVFIMVCVLAVVAAVTVFILVKRRGMNAVSRNAGGECRSDETFLMDDSATEMVDVTQSDNGHDTVMLLDSGISHTVTLTDVQTPFRFFRAPLGDSVIVGRKRELCGITIDYDKSVSGRHCEISVHDGRFYVADLQSLNGTYVDGVKIVSKTELTSGSILKIGKLEMKVELE